MRTFVLSSLLMSTFILPASVMTAPAHAQETAKPTASDLVGVRTGQTLLSISATERTEVQQDLLIATLRFESQGKEAQTVQKDINDTIKKALDKARAVKDVKVSTEQYYVYPYDNVPTPVPYEVQPEKPNPENRIWRGSQSLTLQGKNAESLLNLVGELQALGLAMNGLHYTLSPEKAEETKDSLMEAALGKLRARAERAGKALNYSSVELVEVNVDAPTDFSSPPMMARAMSFGAADTAEKASVPSASPGETEISLTVSTRALLKP